MKRSLFPTLLLTLLASCGSPFRASKGVIPVSRGGTGRGSAVIIGSKWMGSEYSVLALTTFHVIQKGGVIAVRPENKFVVAKVLKTNPELDLALLEFPSKVSLTRVVLSRSKPYFGDDAWTIGFGGGQDRKWISRGYVCGPGRTSAPIAPGDSGGAVVNRDGRLLGIILSVGGRRLPFGMNMLFYHHANYRPAADINKWLRDGR